MARQPMTEAEPEKEDDFLYGEEMAGTIELCTT
jgi:hypothetical protein